MHHFEVDIQPRLSDFDLYGHLNNTHYASYTEVAMYDVLVNGLGFDRTQYAPISRQLSFEFERPIRFGQPISVQTEITQFSDSRITAEHRFVLASQPDKVFATAKRTMVLVSLADGKPAAIPEAILKTFAAKCAAMNRAESVTA